MAKPLILIIEDDPKLAIIYQVTLQQIGYDTVLDPDGSQYNAILSRVHPVLIILDLHMPYASGVDILKQIRCDPQWMDIPVIVVTADLILAKALKGQADEVLLKPVSVDRLRRTVLRLHPGSMENTPEE
jgi:CheY-like chemotaxis protein